MTGTWPPKSQKTAYGAYPTARSPASLPRRYPSPITWQESDPQMVARQPMKFERMLPGNPKPDQYKLMNCSPYKIHQRCAEKFRVGRFLLAADAAHLCNPWGGLGLTGGMVDAGNLADCLVGVAQGIAKESILDKYCEIRREMWHKFINPISSSNTHPENLDHVQEDPFFIMLEEAKKDPEKMKQLVTVNPLR